jgi:hypothetical protein
MLYYSKFPQADSSVVRSVRGAIMGQSEFSYLQLTTSPYDLRYALKTFRFMLIPVVSRIYIYVVIYMYDILI